MFSIALLPRFLALWQSVQSVRFLGWRTLTGVASPVRRGLGLGLVAIALWLGVAVPLSTPVYADAMTPEAEAYEAGPIRQTYDPLSRENFHGGVDPSALEHRENPRAPEDDDKGLLETIKDKVFGEEPAQAPVDLKTQKNPTLERYPDSLK